MLKRASAASVVILCLLVNGCATKFSAITLSNQLKMHEEYGLVPQEIEHFETETMEVYFPRLVKAVQRRGIMVTAVDNLGLALGLESNSLWGYNSGDGDILLDAGLSLDEAFATLLHELGHSLEPKELKGADEGQVFAETLSVLVCRELGLDITRAAFPYLHRFDKRHAIIARYGQLLDQLTADILKEIR
jgi:hypothetical protein